MFVSEQSFYVLTTLLEFIKVSLSQFWDIPQLLIVYLQPFVQLTQDYTLDPLFFQMLQFELEIELTVEDSAFFTLNFSVRAITNVQFWFIWLLFYHFFDIVLNVTLTQSYIFDLIIFL